MKRQFFLTLSAILAISLTAFASNEARYTIQLYGNSYYELLNKANSAFSYGHTKDTALRLSKEMGLNATSYVYFTQGQSPRLSVIAEGKGEVQVSIEGRVLSTLKVNSKQPKEYKIGTCKIAKDGYLALKYTLRSDANEVKMQSLIVDNVTKAPVYLKPETSAYFGMRGPSCHLNYGVGRRGPKIDWATISVTVPEELDQEGSYYMALGFDGGYFGMQNNGGGRRNVLFSTWNTQESDDPKAVSTEHQVQVISHGEGVTAQNFGGEGSGKQSFINAGWQPGHTYRFLLHAEKVDSTTTDYSAWFYDSVNDNWIYLSTLRRPNTKILLSGIHSFLENFNPVQGNKTRKAYYHDAWARTTDGEWKPLRDAFLTCDNTGNTGKRLDFLGGVEDGRFFLMNGGYFDRSEEVERMLSVGDAPVSEPPAIALEKVKEIEGK